MIPGLLMGAGALAGAAGSFFQDEPKASIPRPMRAPVETSSALLNDLATRGAAPRPYEMRAPISPLALLGMGRGIDLALGGAPMPTLAGGRASLPAGVGPAPRPSGPAATEDQIRAMVGERGMMKDPLTGGMTEAYNPVEGLTSILGLISPDAARLLASGRAVVPRYAPRYEQVEGQRETQAQLGEINQREAGSRTVPGKALRSGDPELAARVLGRGNVDAARQMMRAMNKGKKGGAKQRNREAIAAAFGISVEDLMGG